MHLVCQIYRNIKKYKLLFIYTLFVTKSKSLTQNSIAKCLQYAPGHLVKKLQWNINFESLISSHCSVSCCILYYLIFSIHTFQRLQNSKFWTANWLVLNFSKHGKFIIISLYKDIFYEVKKGVVLFYKRETGFEPMWLAILKLLVWCVNHH